MNYCAICLSEYRTLFENCWEKEHLLILRFITGTEFKWYILQGVFNANDFVANMRITKPSQG